MRVLGIDPGYDRLGWAVGEVNSTGSVTVIACDCITTNPKESIFARYQDLVIQFTTVLKQFAPEEAAIETLFFSSNTKTALRVSEARGIIISLLVQAGCSITEYNPGTIKQAVTGTGNATKAAVTKMVTLQMMLPTTSKKVLDDTMDALAILLTHATQRKLRKMTT